MKFKASGGGSSSPYLIKLKSGEFVTGVLRGEPLDYERAFKPGDKPGFRFQINMVVKENGALTAKILEGGWKLYSQLRELSAAGWDLEKNFTRISRQGSGVNDTIYSASVLPTPPDSASLVQVGAVALRALVVPSSQAAPEETPKANNSDVGF